MTICHFSTEHVAPERRLHYWNECAAATFSGMSVDSDSDTFSAEMTRWRAGDFVMARPRSQQSTVRRAANIGGEERVLIHLPRRGVVNQCQLKREQMLRPGDVSICTSAAPLRLQAYDHEMLVMQARRAPLDLRVPDLDDRLCCLVSGAAPAARILHDFVLSLWREGPQAGADPDWESGMAEVLYDLIALALRGTPPAAAPAEGEDLRRLHALVEARLGDPDLGGPALADELGVSMRWVQQLFARTATTPRAYILRRRLERAADRLEANPSLPITVLAFDLGFNDSAYFARCFRQRYGVSPSAWAARTGHASR